MSLILTISRFSASSLHVVTVSLGHDRWPWLNKKRELSIDLINNHGLAFLRGFTSQTRDPCLAPALARHGHAEAPESCKRVICDLQCSRNETTIHRAWGDCVCDEECAGAMLRMLYLADRSWTMILTQVLIFTYWCILLTVEEFHVFCRVSITRLSFHRSLFHACVEEDLHKIRAIINACVHPHMPMQSGTLSRCGAWERSSDSVLSHVWLLPGGFRCSQKQS